MKFDIETIFLILLITFLIYNYYNGDCYNIINYDMNRLYISDNRCYNKNRDRFTGFPTEPKLPKAKSSFTKLPEIILEGLDNNVSTYGIDNKPDINNIALPHEEILNDRYNPLITNYADSELQGIINSSSGDQSMDSSNYNDLLVDDIQRNILLDMDSKLYKKSQRNQKLSKDSKTIASNFGRNALMETYKNEIEFYENKQAWWFENLD